MLPIEFTEVKKNISYFSSVILIAAYFSLSYILNLSSLRHTLISRDNS